MGRIKKTLRDRTNHVAPKFNRFVESKPLLIVLSVFNWPRRQIRRLYAWVVGWSETKQAERALGGIAVAESAFFPIPPDPLLIAMTTAKPKKYLRFATICTVGSLMGGALGYLIGVGLFETVGQWIIDTYHLQDDFEVIGQRYSENAFLALVTAGFTPIPYKLFALSAGVFQVNFLVFMLASLVGRGARFFLVATLMYHFGRRYRDKIERYIDLLGLAFIVLMILGFFLIKVLL